MSISMRMGCTVRTSHDCAFADGRYVVGSGWSFRSIEAVSRSSSKHGEVQNRESSNVSLNGEFVTFRRKHINSVTSSR